METVEFSSDYGKIRGVVSDRDPDVVIFKGIRYARAQRFSYPKRIDHSESEDVYDATSFGAACYQRRAFFDESAEPENSSNYFYWNEFRRGDSFTYSDDCLFMNLWIPRHALENPKEAKLPVLFWIYGGAFTDGCGYEKPMRGEAWCKRDVILVTFNYRVGPFGFCCLPQLKAEKGFCGNYGLFDQLAALQWVWRNIESFGGNPLAITLMGQSAGALSIQQMIGSPLTKGLYVGTISMSLGGASRVFDTGSRTPEDNYPFWQEMMSRLSLTTVDQLRQVDPKRIVDAFLKTQSARKDSTPVMMPVRDGRLVTHSTVEVQNKHLEHRLPFLISSTKNDLAAPVLRNVAAKWCRIENGRDVPAYRAYFTRQLPGDHHGAFHSSDLWYVFGTLAECWRPFTDADYELSNRMMDYLSQFVKNQDPNAEGLPVWRRGTKKSRYMRFDVEEI